MDTTYVLAIFGLFFLYFVWILIIEKKDKVLNFIFQMKLIETN